MVRTLDSWAELERFFDGYFDHRPERRNQFLFRGHSNSAWKVEPTLDRMRRYNTDCERNRRVDRLLSCFQHLASGLVDEPQRSLSRRQWLLLARHHGLPSPILDWTTSPYVALFFAFHDPSLLGEHASIWIFDRGAFADTPGSGKEDIVEIYDDPDDFRFNQRAVEQASVYMMVHFSLNAVNEHYREHCHQVRLSRKMRKEALERLHAMRISSRSLFRSLDHAAQTARYLTECEVEL